MPQRKWSGAKDLEPLLVQASKLKLDAKNGRIHTERNLATIKASLEQYGQLKPVVVSGGVVRAGNGLVMAARDLGWTHVAALRVKHLTDAQAVAYGLMDNKSGDLSEFDFAVVGGLLRDLPPDLLDFTGFADFEREPLMGGAWQPGKPTEDEPEAKEEKKTHPHTVHFSPEQWDIVLGAVSKVQQGEQDDTIQPSRAIELICAEFLSGS